MPRSYRPWLALAAVLLLAGGGYFGWRHFHDAAAAETAKKAPPPAVPATVATVEKADFPVYLKGLGNVQPFNTVTVRSRVDGQVIKIAFRQGQMVKEGDLLAEIDSRPLQAALDQAMAKITQDESDLANARLDLERYTDLERQKFATRQQLDTQRATVRRLEAQVKGDQGAVDNARTQLAYTSIKAPLSGRTGFRLVDQGNNIHASDATGIVTIVQLQPIAVVLTAPEDSVGAINKALTDGQVQVIAQSSDGSRTLATGTLAFMNNEVDQAAGTIRLKARFENTDSALWPGLSVSTLLLVETLKQVIVVPEDAVQHGPNGLFVYTVGEGNKVDILSIKVSHQGNGKAVVSEGLSEGQKVVTAGQSRLQKGTVVQPTAAKPIAPPFVAEKSKAATPKAEAPKAEPPKAETPKPETPKTATP